jgi:TrmH family RNA methyltransferase
MAIPITSLQNERVKQAVKLRDRGSRDDTGLMLVEGYRETKRALDNGIRPSAFFFCRPLFLGTNEDALLAAAAAAGAEMFECSEPVFRKLSYRDRPDGLLAVAPALRRGLADLVLPPDPLLLAMEHVEKPGNLGTMLRSADAGGVHAVIVCDRCTDVFNPNAVRASIGTIFTVPVVEASSDEAIAWLRARGIRILAATPAAETLHTECDLTRGLAIVVGSEQYGLTGRWMEGADERVRIPMLGQCDSLNVAAAATILVFEAVRQRLAAGKIPRRK